MAKRHTRVLLAGMLIATGSLAMVHAQNGPGPARKLHEDLRAPRAQAARTAQRIEEGVAVIGPEPQARKNPTAIASQDKLLAEPSAEAPASKREPVLGRGGFGADRQTESRLDYQTGADNTLHYVEVFNPSIVPFKRMSALDSIREDYTLYSSATAHADIPVGGKAIPGQDLFWGSLMVELQPGLDVPVPSVAPNMRVLSYESTPPTNLVFSKDVADNYYLRTDETGAGGTYRVVFLAEASPYYFAPRVPDRLRIRNIPKDHLPPIPDKVRKVADRVLDELRLHENQLVDQALDELVRYFRSFDAKSPPPNTGDIYWDLYDSQAGVCRHRSFAFMITANALGIPTRYVTNEAHAWVEVWLPAANWMRIDLGGAASTLEVSNASDKSMYRPRGEDPFAKPENYSENYTRLEGDVRGLRDDQIAERQTPYSGRDGSGSGNGSFFGSGDPISEFDDDAPLVGPGEGLPTIPESELVDKLPVFVRVTAVAAHGYRGETLRISGVIQDPRRVGIEGLRIGIFLMPPGDAGDNARLVGRAVSDERGGIAAEVELPADLETKRYEVYLGFDGNPSYQAAVSK